MYRLWFYGAAVGGFDNLDEIRLFVLNLSRGRKLVERECDGGKWQFILKDHETRGPEGLDSLQKADVYEARPSVTIGVPVGGIGVRSN